MSLTEPQDVNSCEYVPEAIEWTHWKGNNNLQGSLSTMEKGSALDH